MCDAIWCDGICQCSCFRDLKLGSSVRPALCICPNDREPGGLHFGGFGGLLCWLRVQQGVIGREDGMLVVALEEGGQKYGGRCVSSLLFGCLGGRKTARTRLHVTTV